MLVLTGATGEITAVTVWEENIVTTQKKCTCLLEGGGGGGGGGGGWLAGGRLRCRLHRATAGAPGRYDGDRRLNRGISHRV